MLLGAEIFFDILMHVYMPFMNVCGLSLEFFGDLGVLLF